MGDVAKSVGVGPDIEFEGVTYHVAPLTYELQAKFEVWLERRAVEAVRRQRPYLTDEEYRAKMAQADRDIAAGVYSFGGEMCVQAAKSIHGVKELLRLTLSKEHPEVDAAFVDRLFEAQMAEAAAALKRASPDPLTASPRAAGAASASDTSAPSSATNHSASRRPRSAG